MKFQELIDAVTESTGLPRAQVRLILEKQAELIANLIETQEDFSCPLFGIKAITNADTGRKVGWMWLHEK